MSAAIPAAFLEAARRLDPSLPRGRAAIARLASLLEAYVFEEEGAESAIALMEADRFVEGAGALLFVALADLLGAEHSVRGEEHRARLDRGSFDFFSAIERCVAAEDPAAELQAQLRLAELEARGEGPHARAVLAFEAALRAGGSQATIEKVHGTKLTLDDGIEVSLDRLMPLIDDRSALAIGASRLASAVIGSRGASWISWQEARTRLLPRIVGAPFFAQLEGRAEAIFARPLLGETCLSLQLKFADRARYVRTDELARWREEGGAPLARTLAAIEEASERTRFAEVESSIMRVSTRDGLDAARILLPGLLARMERRYCGIPHRDVLLFSDDRAALAAAVDTGFASAPHPISAEIFEVKEWRARLDALQESVARGE